MKKRTWLYENSLSVAVIVIFIASMAGQIITGHKVFNDMLEEYNRPAIGIGEYISTGHFISATFENWESEFLQMGLFVVLTIFLRQKGSSESKKCEGEEEVDREPKPQKDAPWPVFKGGMWLSIYKHSLSIALFILFNICIVIHSYGSWINYNTEQDLKNLSTMEYCDYLCKSAFWFESFQNWQSEFLSLATLILLSIYLRQIGSPQSKPVDAPHSETGE